MQKEQNNQQNNDEFFDATVDDGNQKITLDEAKMRAEKEAQMLASLADDLASNKQDKRTFRRIVVMSIGSVVFLLILAIIFFVCLHWYVVGAGVAIIAFVVAQVWLHFFKKWDYGAKVPPMEPDITDFTSTNSTDSDKSADTTPLTADNTEIEKTTDETTPDAHGAETIDAREPDDTTKADITEDNSAQK